MSDYISIPTSAEVYAVIFARHNDELAPFGSFSNPDGTFNGGPGLIGEMETTYALSGTDFPIIAIRSTWDIVAGDYKRHNQVDQYWLCVAKDME